VLAAVTVAVTVAVRRPTGAGPVRYARNLAGQIGLAKAIHDYDLRRVVTFHQRVSAAHSPTLQLPDTVQWMPSDMRPSGDLWAEHVSGAMSAGRRDTLLRRFRELEPDTRGLHPTRPWSSGSGCLRRMSSGRATPKCLFLVTRSLDPTGTGRTRWAMRWKPTLNAFAIIFGDRFPAPRPTNPTAGNTVNDHVDRPSWRPCPLASPRGCQQHLAVVMHPVGETYSGVTAEGTVRSGLRGSGHGRC
jgi:hypothetical protein